jgi:NADPH:quinone reductase-like Zn-dependent oxidoreductase
MSIAANVDMSTVTHRRGLYPPPPGVTDVLGLELSGIIEKVGPGCSPSWQEGDRVAALVPGGGLFVCTRGQPCMETSDTGCYV